MPVIGKVKTNDVTIIRYSGEIFHRCHECPTENFLNRPRNNKDL